MNPPSDGPSHSASASALGYLHQTRWGLLELLRSRSDDPTRSLTMEMYDDVAWDEAGTPTDLKQLKLHIGSAPSNLTDASTDLWRTLRVWMDGASPGDPYGPVLSLITTSNVGVDSAASYLRTVDRDPKKALTKLEETARTSTSKETETSRSQFLALSAANRAAFIERVYVIDQSPDLDGVDEEVALTLRWLAPSEHFDTFMDQVWGWWSRTSLRMLQGQRGPVTVAEAQSALERIRDGYSRENLPMLVEADELQIDPSSHHDRTYVKQLKLLQVRPRPIEKAIIDYQRAYLQETRWLDRHLVDLEELDKFTERLVDEWERAYDHMCDQLPDDASEDDKQAAGRALLHSLCNESALTIRVRFQEQFHARGRRHALADNRTIGWYPNFEEHLEEVLLKTS